MSEQPEKSSARSAIILTILVVVVAAYCIVFGLQTLIWFETHHWTRDNPWINDVPQALDSSPVPSGTAQLKAFDYEFKVPWAGNPKTTPSLGHVEFRFDSGQVVVFFDPEAQADMLRALTSASSPLEYQQFQNVFVGQSFDSNYALCKAVYSAAPSAVSPWMSMRDAIGVNQLLLWKISFGVDATPGIHSIQSGSNRGFEFGDPSSGRPVALRIFNGRDAQFRLIFLVAAGSSAKIAQADIDSAVQSLQVVPIIER
jgi:hypothetical protein